MKKGIKTKILETAIKLFGEQGYNQVSMRDIAGELGISVGNLTYHYKRKEDLVEAAVLGTRKDYQKRAPMDTLCELNDYFIRMFERHKKNAYYFRHYTQLAQVCPAVYQSQVSVIRDIYDTLEQTVHRFVESGLMQPDVPKGRYGKMIKALIAVCVHGIPPMEGVEPMDAQARLGCIWAVLYPTLTKEGKNAFEEIEV
ncbi:TetR/AcrR family transcriptional regulator [Christensenellaceae bacterium OttesenSCG-928-K19]|nr:TetR/AcrR family transcriptional regulator [Christensenellaceae bacterium OttesenSCG-928-K19]